MRCLAARIVRLELCGGGACGVFDALMFAGDPSEAWVADGEYVGAGFTGPTFRNDAAN